MKLGLGKWVGLAGLVGVGMGATIAAQGCTATASVCTGATCPGYTGPGDEDAGTTPTGSEDSGTVPVVTDGSPPVDTGSTPPDPCNSCLYGECVGAYSNCVTNSSCLGIYQCATSPACAADGGSCVQACFNAGDAAGQALYLALGDCDETAQCPNPGAPCASVCNPSAETCAEDAGTAGEDAGSGADAAGGSCNDCQAALCSADLNACAAGSQCAQYNQCVLGCSDTTCATACQSAYAAGYEAATQLGACTLTNCPQCN
jgi:hypothetical protein